MKDYSKEKYSDAINMNRVNLCEAIPLQAPLSLNIDICDFCNFKCKFCAMHYDKRAEHIKFSKMTLDTYQEIIRHLDYAKGVLKKFTFCGYGEPTLNEHLPEMIRLIRERQGENLEIDLVTNGSMLTDELCYKLADSGVDRIMISVEALNDKDYYDITGNDISYNEIIDNVKTLYKYCKGKCEVFVKTVDISVKTDEDREKFIADFNMFCDRIYVEKIRPLWADYDDMEKNINIGLNDMRVGANLEKKVCTTVFYSCIIRTNGDVSPCGADWKKEIVLGNVLDEGFYNVWNGQKMKTFWMDSLMGNKDRMNLCQKCDRLFYENEDNLDDCAEDLLNKLLKKM